MAIRTVFILCLISFWPLTASAQTGIEASNAKEIAYTFYKISGTTPHYERWVKQTQPYLSTPLADHQKVLEEQSHVMREEFSTYDPEKSPLTIKTKAGGELDAANATLELKLKGFDDSEDFLFFPYEYAGDHFGIVIDDLKSFLNPALEPDQIETIKSHLGRRDEVDISLQIVARQADSTEPFVISDIPHWLISAEIGSMLVWNENGVLIYNYTAPWYFSPVEDDLTTLKVQGDSIRDSLNIELDPILLPPEDTEEYYEGR